MAKIAVAAIGGNSLIKDQNHQTVPDQFEAIQETCAHVASMIEHGWNVVMTHGNGPQVGFSLLSKMARRGIKFEYVIADAGYDTKDNYYLISHLYRAVPIIAMNRRNLKKETRDFESYLPIKRGTDLWKSFYQKRGAVERVFSRLKEELALKMVKVRKIDNMKIHAATSLITMLCVALVAIKSGNVDLSKSVNSFKF